MCLCIVSVQADSPLELPLGRCPVPVIEQRHESEHSVRSWKIVVNLQGLESRVLRFRHTFSCWNACYRLGKIHVGTSHFSVCGRIVWIEFDRTLELCNCLEFRVFRNPRSI